jgi:hypothetical protein
MKKSIQKLQLNRETLHQLQLANAVGGLSASPPCTKVCGITDGGPPCTGVRCTGAVCN